MEEVTNTENAASTRSNEKEKEILEDIKPGEKIIEQSTEDTDNTSNTNNRNDNDTNDSPEANATTSESVNFVEAETIDVSKEAPLEDNARNKMFEEGLKHDNDGKKIEALKCYLKCLVGLKENSKFALLPQCLRNIGEIYYGRDEYEKAISFIQAEKLYYESVLVDDSELQKHIDPPTR
ncbi:hypothetical protein ACF0H5_003304 [Mactra antiquata]